MRVAIAGLWHETLTFSPVRTTLEDFRNFQLSEGDEVIARNRGVGNEIGGFIETGCRLGFELVPVLFAGALPSATVSGEAYQFIRRRMLDRLRASMPFNGMLLALHGAMVADGVDDVEMDLLAGIREIVGPSCPIVVTIDLHANLSAAVVDLADVVVGYDTYPHVDIHARGCEAAEILKALLDGLVVRKGFRKLPLLTAPQAQGTSDEPMRSIMQRVHELECQLEILSVTVTAGYPYSDVSRLGMTVTVYSRGDQDLAQNCSGGIARLMWAQRDEFTVRNSSPFEAVRQAIAAPEGPVILVDVADNIGGGTPGDGTVLLGELLRQHAQGAVVTIADPESVAAAIAAGVKGEFQIQAGGKCDSFHGEPVPVRGVVRLISDGVYTHRGSYMTGLRVDLGRTAVVISDGVEIVLMERKAMPFDAEQLRSVGIDPAHKKIIVVKSALAWEAAYGDIARKVIYVDTPGLCSSNLFSFPYGKRPQPVYPLDPSTTYDI
jgi:microcystin degradation protein MlrC